MSTAVAMLDWARGEPHRCLRRTRRESKPRRGGCRTFLGLLWLNLAVGAQWDLLYAAISETFVFSLPAVPESGELRCNLTALDGSGPIARVFDSAGVHRRGELTS